MKYDVIIIGGGIVGLATALKTIEKLPSLKLLLIEKEKTLSSHQTGNNSGVIHSGIYYKPGSLKAQNCITGYKQLIQFCNQEEIPYELCGKIIVATTENQLPALQTLFERGNANGLTGLELLDKEMVREVEPHVAGIRGIRVPQTGIIDFKKVALKYGEKIEQAGHRISLGEKVTGIKVNNGYSTVFTDSNNYETKLIVNCAGLHSDRIALMTQPDVPVRIIPFRGEYYKIRPEKHHLVKNLIYPVPDPSFPFLGVHFTRMIGGGIEAGPNAVLAFAREGYRKSNINIPDLAGTLLWPGFITIARKYWKTGFGEMYRSFSKTAFTQALKQLIPEIEKKDLMEGGAGVRAQACDRKGGLLDDFFILENKTAINVLNAPSPAATSSLAIGQTIASYIEKRF